VLECPLCAISGHSPAASPRARNPLRHETQPQQAAKSAETSAMKMEDVSKWTQSSGRLRRPSGLKRKTQWNDCQTQATAKNLSGRKSWQFLYDCMTK
jgi:hypothetical protein